MRGRHAKLRWSDLRPHPATLASTLAAAALAAAALAASVASALAAALATAAVTTTSHMPTSTIYPTITPPV